MARLRIGADTRLRILEKTNGSGLRFRALLSASCAPMLEVARGHRITLSLLWQCTRAVSERLGRRWVVSGDPNVCIRDVTRYLSALLEKLRKTIMVARESPQTVEEEQ
jgi:hypothetical protein